MMDKVKETGTYYNTMSPKIFRNSSKQSSTAYNLLWVCITGI